MRTFTFPDGVTIDVETGNIIGQQEAAPIPATELGSKRDMDIVSDPDKPVGKQALDAVKQLSWGFNSMLFALPDEIVEQVGKAAGVDEKEIPSLVRYFNAGQVAPENMLERFTNSIGKGIGAGLPMTGIMGAVARTKALTQPLMADAGVAKRIAKDMLDFVRKDPAGAVKADVAFGGAYGAFEQGVEEFMEPGEGKDLVKAFLPVGSVVAVPAMLSIAGKVAQLSPTYQVAKAAAGQAKATGLPDMSQDEIVQQMVGAKTPKIPGMGWAMKKVQAFNERKAGKEVAKILEPLNDPAKINTQEALRITKELEDFIKNDPRLKDLGLDDRFLLDLAQQSLEGSVLAARNQVVRDLSGNPLIAEQKRQSDLENVFLEAFRATMPKAPMEIDQAIKAAYADHMSTVAQATKQIQNATEEEALMFADRFKAVNMDDLGNWFRDSMFAQMEGTFYKLRKQAEAVGAREAVTPSGVPLATRQEGRPLPQYSPKQFENFAQSLVSKYKLTPKDRIFVGNGTPAPVKYIDRLLARFQKDKQASIEEYLGPEIQKWYISQFPENNAMRRTLETRPEMMQELAPYFDALKGYITGKKTEAGALKIMGQGERLPSKQEIAQIFKSAESSVDEAVTFEITRPEALDMLEASLRYRNSAISEYNRRLDFGIKRNEAQKVLDTANDLHRDVEKFVFDTFGKDKDLEGWLNTYDQVFRKGYEKAFPLLATRRAPGGDFSMASEKVVQNALSSADNVRTMNTILGQDNKRYQETLMDAMFDKAYRENVLDKDGLLDPKKYERFLQKNKNVIEAMPEPVQRVLKDQLAAADRSTKRLADLRTRAEDVQDVELMQVLKKASREGADPHRLIMQAIDDPAIMRKLVDTVQAKPEQLEAMRRQVWVSVEKELFNPQNPLFMEQFLQRNSKSLNMLYEPQHLEDLRKLAEMQKRVFAGDRVQGKLSPFMSFDDRLRATIGAGVGTVESTARAAMIRQISPMHAGVSLMTRLITRQQNNAYEAVLYRALTDSDYAHRLVNATASASSPKGLQQQAQLAAAAGVPPSKWTGPVSGAVKIGGIEAVEALEDGERMIPVSQPDVSEFISQNQATPQTAPRPQGLPPAPAPSRNLSQSAPARVLPKMPAQPQPGQYADFARLFPQDFVSPLIEQKQ